jgi:hypothetical protein
MTARRRLSFAQFWRRFVRVPDAAGHLVCPVPHAEQRRFIDAVDARRSDGGPRYGTLLLDWSKQTGKSTTGGAFGGYRLLNPLGEVDEELIGLAAWDLDQTDVVFRTIEQLVDRSPSLRRSVKVFRTEMVYTEQCRDPRTGGTYTKEHRLIRLARDARGSHGLRFTVIIKDEHHVEPDHTMDEAQILTPNARWAQTIVLSYKPPRSLWKPGCPLFDLHKRIEEGDGSIFHSFVGGYGEQAADRIVPWVTPQWIESQRRLFSASPSRFTRIIANQLAGPDEGLITGAELADALSSSAPNPSRARIGVLDLGAVFSETCFQAGHMQGSRLIVDHVKIWRGSREHPVRFDEVEAHILAFRDRTAPDLERIVIDQWQARQMADHLSAVGLTAKLIQLDGATLDKMVTGLKGAFARRLVKIPADAAVLVEQLSDVRAVESRRRDLLRFEVSEGGGRDDAVVCLAMLLADATVSKQLGRDQLPEFVCVKGAHQPEFSRSSCALLGGLYRADDPACRKQCQGFAAAKQMYSDYLRSGAEPLDFWSYVQRHVQRSDADAWAQVRQQFKNDPWF